MSASTTRVEVPEHIKERFRDEYDADPETFCKLWELQTPEFRQQFSEPSHIVGRLATPKDAASSQARGNAQTQKPRLNESEIDALLRKAHGGGRAKVGDARAAGSTSIF